MKEMPEFADPFSGLAKDRKLTKQELIRAVSFPSGDEVSEFIGISNYRLVN
jgi:hypothetical protein